MKKGKARSLFNKAGLVGVVAGSILAGMPAKGVTLAWDPILESWVAGYEVLYGLRSGEYDSRADASTATTVSINTLVAGRTYFFIAHAYTADGQRNPPSNEISYTVPITSPSRMRVLESRRGAPLMMEMLDKDAERIARLIDDSMKERAPKLPTKYLVHSSPMVQSKFPSPKHKYEKHVPRPQYVAGSEAINKGLRAIGS